MAAAIATTPVKPVVSERNPLNACDCAICWRMSAIWDRASLSRMSIPDLLYIVKHCVHLSTSGRKRAGESILSFDRGFLLVLQCPPDKGEVASPACDRAYRGGDHFLHNR